MQYLLLIYSDEKTDMMPKESAAEQEVLQSWYAYTEDMKKAGVFKAGEALQPTTTATTVRVKAEKPLHTDGPFAETKEQLGGFYLIEVKDLDEALKWAARCPGAKTGCIEVRPIMTFG